MGPKSWFFSVELGRKAEDDLVLFSSPPFCTYILVPRVRSRDPMQPLFMGVSQAELDSGGSGVRRWAWQTLETLQPVSSVAASREGLLGPQAGLGRWPVLGSGFMSSVSL